MTDAHWPANLRYLCGFYPSISEVCRRLGINRQQFNKYLSGQVRPSRYNLRRIAEFFSVEPEDLDLPPARFADFAAAPRRDTLAMLPGPAIELCADLVQRSRGALDRYLGYYLRHFYAFSYPAHVITSLAVLARREEGYVWKNLEIMRLPDRPHRRVVMKYEGTALLLGDRIFILECETLLRSAVTELILYPSYRNPIATLSGVQTGAPTVRGRKPTASTVLLEHLGTAPDLRRALRRCGLFHEDAPGVDPDIRARIRNDLGGGYVLEAEEG
jgi:transcriptional regulator with XRE-family HTH domain